MERLFGVEDRFWLNFDCYLTILETKIGFPGKFTVIRLVMAKYFFE